MNTRTSRWMVLALLVASTTLSLTSTSAAQERDRLAESQFPHWSPDGERIAFFSSRDGNYEIYVMDADGSNQERLTHHIAPDLFPTWSPDGKKIAFASGRQGDFYHGPTVFSIFVYDFETRATVAVTHASESPNQRPDPQGSDTYPFWAPDGSSIAYLSTTANGWREIFTVRPDGTDHQQLTDHGHDHWSPVWAPNSREIFFNGIPDGVQDWKVYSYDLAEGRELAISVDSPGDDGDVAISPDGKRIVFKIWAPDQDLVGGSGFFFMDIDGRNRSSKALQIEDQLMPSWSPDGMKIAFVSTRAGGEREIYVMNVDGSGTRRLTFSN